MNKEIYDRHPIEIARIHDRIDEVKEHVIQQGTDIKHMSKTMTTFIDKADSAIFGNNGLVVKQAKLDSQAKTQWWLISFLTVGIVGLGFWAWKVILK